MKTVVEGLKKKKRKKRKKTLSVKRIRENLIKEGLFGYGIKRGKSAKNNTV